MKPMLPLLRTRQQGKVRGFGTSLNEGPKEGPSLPVPWWRGIGVVSTGAKTRGVRGVALVVERFSKVLPPGPSPAMMTAPIAGPMT